MLKKKMVVSVQNILVVHTRGGKAKYRKGPIKLEQINQAIKFGSLAQALLKVQLLVGYLHKMMH